MTGPKWAYGLTTCRDRAGGEGLRRTLASLKAGGFPDPWLFVDGTDQEEAPLWLRDDYGPRVTFRGNLSVRTVGNWVLGLWELWVRNPVADHFAMFQDDFVCVRGLREYLEATWVPGARVYRNLYLFESNASVKPPELRHGWYESRVLGSTDNPKRYQTGRGAVALVFDRAGVEALLSSPILVRKPTDMRLAPDRTRAVKVPKPPPGEGAVHATGEDRPWVRGEKTLDGCIVTAMNDAGWRETVHFPSLTQHTGGRSSMQNLPHQHAVSFPGEEWDARGLLK